jgi:hypothetical protein
MAAKHQQERIAQIKSQADGIIADCDGKIPAVKGQFVNRQRCKRPALELYKQLTPYADLVDQEIAMRMAVAEKLDTGKMTMAEAELATAQSHSQIMSEEQRRNLSSRSWRHRSHVPDEFAVPKAFVPETLVLSQSFQRRLGRSPSW